MRKSNYNGLTAKQVIFIRYLRETFNYSYVKLAKRFKVSKSCIWAVVKRKSWKNI